MNEFLKAAIEYSKRGWFTVPDHSITAQNTCTCMDTGCIRQGKHPRMERGGPDGEIRGVGSVNSAQLAIWWTRWPESNVAIVCGRPSNIVAIDIDKRNGGLQTLVGLQERYGALPATLTSLTGGGGKHLFFLHPGREDVRNRIGLFPGVDVKADRGRIVAPPSRHISGVAYKWENYNVPLAPLPRWLLNLIQTAKGTGSWQAMRRMRGEQ